MLKTFLSPLYYPMKNVKNGDKWKSLSKKYQKNMIDRRWINLKKKYLVIILILIILAIIASIIFKQYKNSKRSDVKIPILLYHDFVTIVPDYDSDNFSYINTPQSFEENIKVLLENGYTFLSMKELYDANNGKIELPAKPILITMDDGYYSNYEYIYPILKKYHVKASIFVVTDKTGMRKNSQSVLSSYIIRFIVYTLT